MLQNCTWTTFPNIGYTMADLTEEQLQPIKDEIKKIQNDFSHATMHNSSLVGHMRGEYKLIDSHYHIQNLAVEMAKANIQSFPSVLDKYKKLLETNPKLILVDPWVNFQKKHDHNPIHIHDGVLSFVIWIQLPYNIEEEYAEYPNMNSYDNCTGCFRFHYTDAAGRPRYHKIEADRKFEGKFLMFSNELQHSVSPFYTSDEYRISVAGNLYLEGDYNI